MPNDNDLIIRKALPADIPAIIELIPELVAFGPPPWRDAAAMTETDTHVIRAAVLAMHAGEDAVVYVGCIAGIVHAFVHMRAAVDYYTRTAQGHVADLVVADNARGSGIGTRLLEEAEAWAHRRGFRYLSIAVFERNVSALTLYEHRGFQREIIRLIKPL